MKQVFSLRKLVPIFIGLLMIILWTVFTMTQFIAGLTAIEIGMVDNDLSVATDSNAAEVRYTFNHYINALNIVATSIQRHADFKSPEALALLADIANIEGYERLVVVYPDGSAYTSDGYVLNVADFGYADKIENGETFIDDVKNSLVDGEPVIGIFVPLYDRNSKPTASLRSSIATKRLATVFSETFASMNGYTHVIDSNGKCIVNNNSTYALENSDNYFDMFERVSYAKGFSEEQVKSAFANKQKGYVKYSDNEQDYYTYYAPMGINDWYVITTLPKEFVDNHTNKHSRLAIILTAQIACMLIIVFAYVYVSQRNERNKARLNEKCFVALTEQTGKAICDWNLITGKITFSENYAETFGRGSEKVGTSNKAMTAMTVHPDDQAIYKQLFIDAMAGYSNRNVRYRTIGDDGVYRWCEFSSITVCDHKGKPYRAIAAIANIDEQVKKEIELSIQATQDRLTGLYNKITTELLIEQMLIDRQNMGGKHALMIIDIDNFKNINDRLGHLYGDNVLSALAKKLKAIFRSDDIIGRIGGDEFFVFLKNFTDQDIVESKAQEICVAFRDSCTVNDVSVSISASIGISLCPEHGTDIDTLYNNADTALYITKSNGKDSYTVYDGISKANYQSARTEIENHTGKIAP